jgi:hypothetical protein
MVLQYCLVLATQCLVAIDTIATMCVVTTITNATMLLVVISPKPYRAWHLFFVFIAKVKVSQHIKIESQ